MQPSSVGSVMGFSSRGRYSPNPWYICHALIFVSNSLKHVMLLKLVFTGTTKVKNLENNIGSLEVKLTGDDLKEICDAVPVEEVSGEREYDAFDAYLYKFANTPEK